MASRSCFKRLLELGGNDAKYARTFNSACLAFFVDDEEDFISLPRVDTDVVDQHCRREDRVRLRISVEVPTDGEIEHQEKRLVEYRSAIMLYCVARNHVMKGIVHEESDRKRIPFNGKCVEVVRQNATRETIRMGERRLA